jgi:Flp pilus assembly protein TadG
VEIVEFALVLPVVLTILLAIIEAGWMFKNQLILANATRDGARYAALGNNSVAVRARIKSEAATLNPALTDANIILEQSTDKTSLTPFFTGWAADLDSKNSVAVGNIIRIRVAYAHRPLTVYFPFMKDRILNVAVTMLREAN